MPVRVRKKAPNGQDRVRQQTYSGPETAQPAQGSAKKKTGRKGCLPFGLPDWNPWELYALSPAALASIRTPDQQKQSITKSVAELYGEKLRHLPRLRRRLRVAADGPLVRESAF